MTKLILITLGVLMVVGVSYQAKRTYDARHANGVTGTNGTHADGSSAKTAGDNGFNDMTGTGNNAQGVNGSGANGVGMNGTQGAGTTGASNGSTSANGGTAGVNGTGTAGTTGANGANAPVAKAVPEKPKDNCFAFEYRHKKEARDQDIENFLDYTNAFPLPANYNPKSLCVKVNQKAVNFQVAKHKTEQEVRVGSMVGPESVIRVSYCVGKVVQCHEKCDQPKKRFMDDLMSDATDDDSFSDSWGKDGDEAHKKELKAKAKELRTIASENDHLNEGSVQRDWEELQKQESYCK